jgi:hypothetical protein
MFRLDRKALLIVVAILVASVSAASARLSAATASSPVVREAADQRLPAATPAGETTLFGHIKSLVANGRRYELRFDPALWLTGLPAESACGCRPVANDYYILDESHRLLTYVVPSTAHVTVLTGGVHGTAITVSELAQILKGKNPNHRRLSQPKAGFWIRVGFTYPAPVLALDQQYQP